MPKNTIAITHPRCFYKEMLLFFSLFAFLYNFYFGKNSFSKIIDKFKRFSSDFVFFLFLLLSFYHARILRLMEYYLRDRLR